MECETPELSKVAKDMWRQVRNPSLGREPLKTLSPKHYTIV